MFWVFSGSAFPDYAYWVKSADMLVICLLGGIYNFFGPVAGTLIYTMLTKIISEYTIHWHLILGGIIVLIILAMRKGVVGSLSAYLAGRKGAVGQGRAASMLLETKDLSKSFGGLSAVAEVSLSIGEQELVSIIGPNGAGKSTLFNLITGHISPDRGTVLYKGQDITGRKPYEVSRLGVGRSFQKLNIFPRLTTFQNVQAALFSVQKSNRKLFADASRMMKQKVEEVLENVGLGGQSNTLGGLLAHGDQKRLELGIALALDPEILLLDEPTQGMSPGETRETTELIRDLVRARRISLVFVEHDMSVVFGISDRINVLHQGVLIFSGKPEEVRANEEVQRIYLGKGDHQCFCPSTTQTPITTPPISSSG
eukprot:TRINITY_DN5137_c0_g1_i1.p1 TRINITY_DN5137_c0_g1~~TRINITY_DN5137_c0_g1_i1.p1  ORF type:complete len:368 (-),score=109.23 TRINITY_DN5137_c0_g1_i1:432-1535(-)